jgi:glycosyltransferase involved in cell wall biosynthesis
MSGENGYGVALRGLFHGWPAERLFQMSAVSDYSRVAADREASAGLAWFEGIHGGGRKRRLLAALGFAPGALGRFSIHWLRRSLGGFAPEVVYAFVFRGETLEYAAWAAAENGVPLVVHVTDQISGGDAGRIDRALAGAGAVLAVTADLAAVLAGRSGRPCDIYLPCGVGPGDYLPDAGRAVKEGGGSVVRYLGSLHPPEYPDSNFGSLSEIARAVRQIRASGADIRMELFGGGERTRRLSGGIACGDAVRYLGAPGREEAASLLASADLLVIPLTFDPAGREATRHCFSAKLPGCLASGTPTLIYAPAESAISAYCRERGLGILVDQPSVEALAEVIRSVAADPAGARERAAKDRDFALRELSVESLSAGLRERLCRLVREREGAG